MARNHGRILASAWDPDSDLRTLDRGLQGLYFFLISQSNLNHAGLLPITLRRWAACADGDTPAAVETALCELHARRYIVVDWDTEELLVRTLVRNDGIWKQPKVMLAMVSAVAEIESRMLRRALLAELERLPLAELNDEPGQRGGPSVRRQVADCVQAVREMVGPIDRDPTPDPKAKPTETVPDTQAETLPDTPEEGDAEGIRDPLRARVHPRAPAPSPAPTTKSLPHPLPPTPPPAGAGRAAHELADVIDLADHLPARAPQTTDELVADWIEHIAKRPPGSVIGRVGKHIKQMLEDDHLDPADIRRGLAVWARKGKDPSTLPSIVNEVMNAAQVHQAAADLGGDEHMARFLARQAALRDAR